MLPSFYTPTERPRWALESTPEPQIRLPRIERSSIRREALAVPHMYRARAAAWRETVTPARM